LTDELRTLPNHSDAVRGRRCRQTAKRRFSYSLKCIKNGWMPVILKVLCDKDLREFYGEWMRELGSESSKSVGFLYSFASF
jgi:DNA-binding HxlR family transcriptional regulator